VSYITEDGIDMRRRDMNTFELYAEAVGIVATLLYIGLQIYYGFAYGQNPLIVGRNVLAMILVYVGMSLLECYPERVNGLLPSQCTGNIRKYTIRMVRTAKLIFTGSLLLTSVCDAMGHELNDGYSVLVVILIVVTAIYYEYKIIKLIRKKK
jgi:hypothetical protein